MKTFASLFSLLGFAVGLSVMTLAPDTANAVPAFARKHDLACSACHTAWPLLNSKGRAFKENGYRLTRKETQLQDITEYLEWGEKLPLAVIVKARPFDKKGNGGDPKVRAIHEVEIMVAGTAWRDVSVFFELEGEDEENFEVSIATAAVTWTPLAAFNLQVANSQLLYTDPYDTLAGARRLTRGRNAVIDQKFGSADNGGKLRDRHQNVSIYGRPIPQLFYTVGWAGVAKDAEGESASTFFGKIAFDLQPDVTFGVFGIAGECKAGATNCDVDRNFTRFGVDAQAEYQNVRLQGAYIKANDDRNGVGEDENDAWYVEGLYTVKLNGRPVFVPSIRYDSYQKNDGSDRYGEVVLNLAYYHKENIRAFVEYWTQVDAPAGVNKNNRITFQIDLGF